MTKFFFSCFATTMLKISGRVMHHWKGNGILQASKFLIFQLVEPKKFCSRLVTVEHAGQHNCNGKTIMAVLVLNVFYKCIEGKSGIRLLLAMFISDYWMVNLMIIYIEKIIAKALEINNIIKKYMGMLA